MNQDKCNICKKELNTGTIPSVDCGGDCLECMASFDDPDAVRAMAFHVGFNAACNFMASQEADDLYGIGSMCSQWNNEDVAEDLRERALKAWEKQ